ncbi:MAG: hypothetical protein MI702_11890 [Chlorobiales bacterium]|nr:hypothetical protein [Chlorobiales bacterium]
MSRKLKMLTGQEIELDGDLMAIIENLYQEVVVRKELKHTYIDMKEEIDNLISQMEPEDLRNYLSESVFMNTVSYENQMLEALLQKLQSEDDTDE